MLRKPELICETNQGQDVLDTTHVNREHHLLAKTEQRCSFINSLSIAHADRSCANPPKAPRHPAHGKGPCRPAWLAPGSYQGRAGGPLQRNPGFRVSGLPRGGPGLWLHIGLLESFLGGERSPDCGPKATCWNAKDAKDSEIEWISILEWKPTPWHGTSPACLLSWLPPGSKDPGRRHESSGGQDTSTAKKNLEGEAGMAEDRNVRLQAGRHPTRKQQVGAPSKPRPSNHEPLRASPSAPFRGSWAEARTR